MAKTSAELIMFLANDMLDYSQIEAGKLRLTYEQFNVYDACKELVDLLKSKAESKGIRLMLQEGLSNVTIKSDINRFKQILMNLVSNAIKFTFEGYIKIYGHEFYNTVTHSR